MRVSDGPGEAPARLLGGCKMLIFHVFFFRSHSGSRLKPFWLK